MRTFIARIFNVIMSHIFTFNGRSNVLEANFHPPIDLRDRSWSYGKETWSHHGTWVMGLMQFETFHTIPNITAEEHKFYIRLKTGETIEFDIPVGAYDIDHIIDEINARIQGEQHRDPSLSDAHLIIWPNPNTQKIHLHSKDLDVDFTPADSIANLFGFDHKIYVEGLTHVSEHHVRISPVNAIRIACNITVGSYVNGEVSHTIHEFFPNVPPGFKLLEIPHEVVYLPISSLHIDNITLRLLDEHDKPLEWDNEEVNIRLHLKRVPWD